jgi:hypothetical protein
MADEPNMLLGQSEQSAEALIPLRRLLEDIVLNDRSATYDYGETRHRDGRKPDPGKCWNTPREMARAALVELDRDGRLS